MESGSRRARQPVGKRRRWSTPIILAALALVGVALAALLLLQNRGGSGTTTAALHVLGDPNAPVTVEEWSDIQ